MLAAIDSSWVIVIISATSAVVGGSVWLLDRWRTTKKEITVEAQKEAQAPAHEMAAASRAAEAIAGAAAQLLAPFQETVRLQTLEIGELRAAKVQQGGQIRELQEEVRVSREAEEKCQRDLAKVRAKLAEVTDHLHLEPPPALGNGGG